MSIFNKNKSNNSLSSATKWAWEFTKGLITTITILYFICTAVEIALIVLAIYQTGTFSYLDTFITEINTTFRDIVCVNLVKCIIENVFKYNDFSGITHKNNNIKEEEEIILENILEGTLNNLDDEYGN